MKVFSIFDSIDGEVNFHGQGHPTTFIRLAGCSLNCSYCDTQYARDPDSGTDMSVKEIIRKVMESQPYKVTITGGEPLEQQKELEELVRELWALHVFATIETNGAHPIPILPCTWVADYKLKGSGMNRQMQLDHFKYLNPDSYIKFVITDYKDYIESKEVMARLREKGRWMKFAMSPIMPGLPASELLSWMKRDHLNSVLLNIQIHKLLDLSEDKPEEKKQS